MGCFSSAPSFDSDIERSADRASIYGSAQPLPEDIMDIIWNFVGFEEPIWGNVIRDKSEVCSAGQLDWLITKTPKVLHCFDWKCHFCTQRDGTSMITFREKVSIHSETLLIIKDKDKNIFGAYANRPWKKTQSYTGDQKNFLYAFPLNGMAKIYQSTGENILFQKIDKDALFLGGSEKDAKCALFLTGNFSRGHSHGENNTYTNTKSLSTNEDFDIVAVKVWGPMYWDESEEHQSPIG